MAPFSSKKSKFDKPGPTKRLFTREAHKLHREPTISVSSPDCGPSGQIGNLNAVATSGTSAELFPTLTWHFEHTDKLEDDVVNERLRKTKEYLVIVEDLDGTLLPFSTPPLLGVYYCIPPETTSINGNELVKLKKGVFERITVAQRGLIGGYKYAVVDGKVWNVPKSMHRVHFQVIAVSKSVDTGSLSEFPSVASFRGAVEGFVLGWGEWVGIYEKK
jgi:hypothetical protein